ncbi:hypothetical protein RRSWK_02524 [Rhodopirellula sp. SWK7]|nr:hypothetical protein RRSWK_02524 [Rhodopirellula sp. SWK7]
MSDGQLTDSKSSHVETRSRFDQDTQKSFDQPSISESFSIGSQSRNIELKLEENQLSPIPASVFVNKLSARANLAHKLH